MRAPRHLLRVALQWARALGAKLQALQRQVPKLRGQPPRALSEALQRAGALRPTCRQVWTAPPRAPSATAEGRA